MRFEWKKQRVFISCVSEELGSYRSRLTKELRRRGVEVKVQEDFRQGSGTLLQKLKRCVADCDAAIFLIGDQCGHLASEAEIPDQPRRSYTQWEFHFALARNKQHGLPIFIYLKPSDDSVPNDSEGFALQRKFIEFVETTGLDREPLLSEDDLVIRVLHQDWGASLSFPMIVIPLIMLLAAGIGVATWNTKHHRLTSLETTEGQRIASEAQEYLSQLPEIVDTETAPRTPVETMPAPDNTAFVKLESEHVWDTRGYTEHSTGEIGPGGSALTLHYRRLLRKVTDTKELVEAPKSVVNQIRSRPSSGLPVKIFELQRPRIVGNVPMHEIQEHYDVSGIPVGQEFMQAGVRTYWNSLQTKQDLWVGTIANSQLRWSRNLILFGSEHPWKSFWLTAAKDGPALRIEPLLYKGKDFFFVADEAEHRWLYWEIVHPSPGYVYQLRWDW